MAKQTWVKDNGQWRKVKSAWVNVGGVWKKDVMPKGVVSGGYKEFMEYDFDGIVIYYDSNGYICNRNGELKNVIGIVSNNASVDSSGNIYYHTQRHITVKDQEGNKIKQIQVSNSTTYSSSLPRLGIGTNHDIYRYIKTYPGFNMDYPQVTIVKKNGEIIHGYESPNRVSDGDVQGFSSSRFTATNCDYGENSSGRYIQYFTTSSGSLISRKFMGYHYGKILAYPETNVSFFTLNTYESGIYYRTVFSDSDSRSYQIYDKKVVDFFVTNDFIYVLNNNNKVLKLRKVTNEKAPIELQFDVDDDFRSIGVLKNGEICLSSNSKMRLYSPNGDLIVENTKVKGRCAPVFAKEFPNYYND